MQNTDPEYEPEPNDKEALLDDFQRLFVALVAEHAEYIIECKSKDGQPKPLRLLLLGTAGT